MIRPRLTGNDLLNKLDELAWRASNKADELRANPARRRHAVLFDRQAWFWRDLHAAKSNGHVLSAEQIAALEWAATEKRRMTWAP